MDEKIGRNDPCPCGSGKKYKKCCLGKLSASSVDSENFVSLDELENDPEYQKICQEIDEIDYEWHDEHPGSSGHVNACDFCSKMIESGVDYTITQTICSNFGGKSSRKTVSEKFCSFDCKMAAEILQNSIFMGFSSDLISHLRDEHGFKKADIKAGIDRILLLDKDMESFDLLDWEKYY